MVTAKETLGVRGLSLGDYNVNLESMNNGNFLMFLEFLSEFYSFIVNIWRSMVISAKLLKLKSTTVLKFYKIEIFDMQCHAKILRAYLELKLEKLTHLLFMQPISLLRVVECCVHCKSIEVCRIDLVGV